MKFEKHLNELSKNARWASGDIGAVSFRMKDIIRWMKVIIDDLNNHELESSDKKDLKRVWDNGLKPFDKLRNDIERKLK